jgi:hypothetical protein
MPAALEVLGDCVVNPAFREGELEDQKMRLAMMLSSPDIALTLMPEVRSWGPRERGGCRERRVWGAGTEDLRVPRRSVRPEAFCTMHLCLCGGSHAVQDHLYKV